MMRWVAPLVVVVTLAVGAQGQVSPAFRFERTVETTSGEAHRLEIDVPLLAGSRPFVVSSVGERWIASVGLADLRFYNPSRQEVPYLLVPPPTAEPQWHRARVLPVVATEKTSGFEADLGDMIAVDAVRLGGMRAPFLKRLVLEGSGDRERWTRLASEGTLFDLPGEGLEQTTLAFTPGPYRYLRATWDDTNSGRVQPPESVEARRVPQPITPAATLRAALVVERRPSEPGVSRFRVRLPAAKLPIVQLELGVGGGHLLREVRVMESRLTGEQAVPDMIGRATLRRIVRDGIAADALRISVAPPREAQLDLVVDDGNNSPLDLKTVTAVFAELPWIYFEHQPGTLVARWGDPKLEAPRYDLEAARPVVTVASTTPGRWGDTQGLGPSAEGQPELPMPETGAALQSESFRYSRPIPAGAGLAAVPLDAAVLAHSGALSTGFADVRVLDPSGRQVPYLVEKRDEPIALDVRIRHRELPAPVARLQQGRTPYFIDLPYRRLPGARIVLHTRARVFRRGVSLGMLVPPSDRRREPQLDQLSSTLWQHSNPDMPARGLVFDVPETRRGEIVLIVDEGDNQQLPIEKATLSLPSYAIRLYRPVNQPLRLMYGREDLRAPRYDLALLAPRVLGSVAQEAYPGREEPSGASASTASIVSPPAFWAALGFAVVVLLGMIVRLVRGGDGAAAA